MAHRPVNLIEVANVGSLPLGLRSVAALDYSGITPPNDKLVVGATWGSLGSVWPNNNVKYGAVRYPAGASTPLNLVRVAAVVPDIDLNSIPLSLSKVVSIIQSLGSELVTNGTMEADANWANRGTPSINAQSTEQVFAGSFSRKFAAAGDDSGIQSSAFTTVTGTWYQASIWIFAAANVDYRLYIRNGIDNGYPVSSLAGGLFTDTPGSWANTMVSYRELFGGNGAYVGLATHNSGTYYADNVSLKPLTLSSCLGAVGNPGVKFGVFTASPTVSSQITQCGLACCVDKSEATYGLFAYHDHTNVYLDTLENGTWTNKIAVAVTYVAGAPLQLKISGSSVELWYNGSQVGGTQTINLAAYGTQFYGFSTLSTNNCGTLTWQPNRSGA